MQSRAPIFGLTALHCYQSMPNLVAAVLTWQKGACTWATCEQHVHAFKAHPEAAAALHCRCCVPKEATGALGWLDRAATWLATSYSAGLG